MGLIKSTSAPPSLSQLALVKGGIDAPAPAPPAQPTTQPRSNTYQSERTDTYIRS